MKVLKGRGVIVLGLIVVGVIAAIVGESGDDDDNGGSTPARVAEEAPAPITAGSQAYSIATVCSATTA
jgi:hypothetical protein